MKILKPLLEGALIGILVSLSIVVGFWGMSWLLHVLPFPPFKLG